LLDTLSTQAVCSPARTGSGQSMSPTVRDPSLTLSFVHSWRRCCSTELMKHYHGASVTAYRLQRLLCEHKCTYLLTYLLPFPLSIWSTIYTE